MNNEWLKNAHCFTCDAEDVHTPVNVKDAEKSLDECGLIKCAEHLAEWRINYGKN